jgi:cytidylate kinase
LKSPRGSVFAFFLSLFLNVLFLTPKFNFRILFDPKTREILKNLKNLVIAIDGPAASGKSTTARLVAERLGYLYVDTGAMYRAMTLKVLEHKLDLRDEAAVGALARKTVIRLGQVRGELRVTLDGRDVTGMIRDPGITECVSAVSAMKAVREVMVREQRNIGAGGGVVLEGRDIGTVVFPRADLKVFMVADARERAKRRKIELEAQGTPVDIDRLEHEIAERDRKDSSRDISPLRKAEGAITVDTSGLTIEQQVDRIVGEAKKILQKT